MSARRTARAALRAWGIAADDVRMRRSLLDTTFRVRAADGRVYAVRVGGAGHQTAATLRSEVAWIRHLHDAGLPVPAPAAEVHVAGEAPCSLLAWLPGRKRRALGPAQAREAGALLSAIHRRSREFRPSGWFERKRWDGDRMCGVYAPGPSALDRLLAPAERRRVDGVVAALRALYERLRRDGRAHGVIVGDYGPGNLVWHRGRPQLVDHNDTGWGLYAYDLAYICGSVGDDVVAGYGEPPPGFGPEVRAAYVVRLMRWRAVRPGGDEGAHIVRELYSRLDALL